MSTIETRNIGIILDTLSAGGGTFQWTENILYALRDYYKNTPTARIHVFYNSSCLYPYQLSKNYEGFVLHHKKEGIITRYCKRLFRYFPFLVRFIRIIYPMKILLSRNNIDTLIIPGASMDAALCKGKIIFMFTDIAHKYYPQFREIKQNNAYKKREIIFRYGIKYADRVVVESEQLKKDVMKYYHANPKKLWILFQTVPNTVIQVQSDNEIEYIKLNIPENYILYPARLWEHKNHINLIKAFKIVIQSYPSINLVLTGNRYDGDERIFNLIDSLCLRNNVVYVGYVANKFMPTLYKNAKMLVMPTFFGPTNIPTLEAFYFGCPAVISDIPGVKEQTGNAALLFDPKSPIDIADKILKVLENEEIRSNMIKSGRERIKILSYEKYLAAFSRIIE